MNQRISWLAVLLVVQLLLVGLLSLGTDDEQSARQLLDIEANAVTRLQIADAEGNSVELNRGESGWLLGEVPADAGKITDTIETLVSGSASWPVATSVSSQERFEVTADSFQRRVSFGRGDEPLAVLYLGTSPGFRRVHARRDGEDAVYSIDYVLSDLPATRSDWLDKNLFQTDEIASVTLPSGQVLTRNESGDWFVDGEAADPAAMGRYLNRITDLSVLGFFEPAPAEEAVVLGEAAVLQVEDGQGSHSLSFSFNEADDEYVLTSDRVPGQFIVASYIVEQILIDAMELVAESESESESEPNALPDDAEQPVAPITP